MTTHYIHRGLAKKNFKENTLSSFRYSVSKRNMVVETDLTLSPKDNQNSLFS